MLRIFEVHQKPLPKSIETFFPRDGLLPRLPPAPNLRVAPAMSGWNGPAGKR